MIRINLLPPEILEKRKAESRRLYLVAIGLAVLALLGLFWAFMALQVQIKQGEVASAEQTATSLEAQANRFKVFEDRTKDLDSRKAIAAEALSGRINWSKLLTEISLVMPADLWLELVDGTQQTGQATGGTTTQQRGAGSNTQSVSGAILNLRGWSLLVPAKANDGGMKSIAKLLVRLNDLEQLNNVWLTSAEQKAFVGTKEALEWATSSDIVTPGSQTATSTTAPPPPPANP